MNRFIRCLLIAGLGLSVFGFGMAIAARANGGNWQQLNLRNHSMTIGDRHWNHDLEWEENTVQEVDENTVRIPLINELNLELNACELTITNGEVDEIIVSCDSYMQMKDLIRISYDDDDELSITTGKKDDRTPKINITVPSGWLFDEVNIKLVSGNCVIQHMNIQELTVYLSEGKLMMEDATAYETDFQCTGGSIVYHGLLLGDTDIQCSGGKISIDLQQSKKEFNYEIEANMGEVLIGTEKFSGLIDDREIINYAEWTMEVECTAGKVEIACLSEE